ncbi:MAG: sporulation protein [Legionella sp.]|nr:MAG: sporulation protein [Legionella sp.]PJD99225.1 MAG: sporulation protein [Legionella sp.]
MKLVINEQLKHRLIGIAVIISLGAIFAPAMVKKSNQSAENNYSVRVKLPPKPVTPNVAVSDEKEVFKTIKIAQINLPQVNEESQLPQLASASRLHAHEMTHEAASLVKPHIETQTQSVQVAIKKATKSTVKQASYAVKEQKKAIAVARATRSFDNTNKKTVKVAAVRPQVKPSLSKSSKQGMYAIQLASFSRLGNAQALVNKLHSKGYRANYVKVSGRQGVSYKVFAGHSIQKTEVLRIKTQLASAMQLNGFIVTTGVS